MRTLLAGIFIASVASWVLTYGARWAAPRVGAMDMPDNFRKLQAKPMPRMGGIPIFLAVLCPLVLLLFLFPSNYVARELLSRSRAASLAGLLLGGSIALTMGFVDDLFGLRPRYKLLFQLAAATVAYFLGFAIQYVNLPFVGGIHLSWASYPFTVFWFLACMNAINLADGLDGLAAGLAFFATLSLAVVGVLNGHSGPVFFAAIISAAVFGFLIHNFHPASIYLGDSGSMLLGFWLAALGICCSRKSTAAVSLLVPMIALGLPILDTATAILRRWIRRLPISAGDRQHIHHTLLRLGYSHRNAVLVAYGICIVLGILAFVSALASDGAIALLVISLVIVAFTFARIFCGVRPDLVLKRLAEDQRNRALTDEARIAVNQAVSRLETARDLQIIWDICTECLSHIGTDHASLTILTPDAPSPSRTLKWAADSQAGEAPHPNDLIPDSWTARLQLRDGDRVLGEFVVLRHAVAGHMPLPGTAPLLAKLRDALAQSTRELSTQTTPIRPGETGSIPAATAM